MQVVLFFIVFLLHHSHSLVELLELSLALELILMVALQIFVVFVYHLVKPIEYVGLLRDLSSVFKLPLFYDGEGSLQLV